jgi:predicted enzyme related to lactoylglutathione lyase
VERVADRTTRISRGSPRRHLPDGAGAWSVDLGVFCGRMPEIVGGLCHDEPMTTRTFAPGSPNWVDLGTTDLAGATAFYGNLFGWTVDDLGPDAGGYGMIKKNGQQVGGIGPATDPGRGTSWGVYFASDDADATAAAVESHGGKVIVASMDVMDQGRMAVFTDPSGAFFSVWQPGQHQGFEAFQSDGAVCWVELMTSDIAEAKSFYEAVLPVTTRDAEIGEGSTYTLLAVAGADVAGAMQMPPDMPASHSYWSVYFAVEDCDATADKAIELGASEMLRQDSPAGRFAILTDPQGGLFSVIRPNPDFSM